LILTRQRNLSAIKYFFCFYNNVNVVQSLLGHTVELLWGILSLGEKQVFRHYLT